MHVHRLLLSVVTKMSHGLWSSCTHFPPSFLWDNRPIFLMAFIFIFRTSCTVSYSLFIWISIFSVNYETQKLKINRDVMSRSWHGGIISYCIILSRKFYVLLDSIYYAISVWSKIANRYFRYVFKVDNKLFNLLIK